MITLSSYHLTYWARVPVEVGPPECKIFFATPSNGTCRRFRDGAGRRSSRGREVIGRCCSVRQCADLSIRAVDTLVNESASGSCRQRHRPTGRHGCMPPQLVTKLGVLQELFFFSYPYQNPHAPASSLRWLPGL